MSGWTDALGVVAKLAPMIATGLAGPLVGGAVAALEGVFGITPVPNASIDDRQATLAAAITGATPEQLQAIRKGDQDYAARMAEAGFKDVETLAQLAVQDRDSARNREIQTKDRTPAHLAYMIIGGFFSVAIAQLTALMGWPEVAAKIPPQGWVIIGNISGYLAAEAKSAAAYYFGTTQDSGRKTELLAQSTPAQQ